MIRKLFFFAMFPILLFGCNADPRESEDGGTEPEDIVLHESAKQPQNNSKVSVNLFVENSGSMSGYISLGNEFDRVISSLMTQVDISDFASEQSRLFYINSDVFLQKDVSLQSFIKNLTVHNANTYKGDLSETSFTKLFDLVLKNTKDNAVSIFVSDCIFSVGNNDASQYIGSEKDGVTQRFAQELKKRNLAIKVIRYNSSFKGKFFGHKDALKKDLNGDNRPFFVWIIGDLRLMNRFDKAINWERIDYKGQLDEYAFVRSNSKGLNYFVDQPSSGRREDNHTLSKAKLDNGKYSFRVHADLSNCALLGDSYILNPNNYQVSNNQYKIAKIEKRSVANTSHVFTLTTYEKVVPSTISVSLQNKQLPEWVSKYNINPKDSDKIFVELQKTYGLKAIMDGVYTAFFPKTKAYATFSVKIK